MTVDWLLSRYLAAQTIALEAGQLARRFLVHPEDLHIELKGVQDFVSTADRAVEELIVQRLAAAFPGDALRGEEGHTIAADETSELLWVIDPIDGTANFIRDLPDWCVSIGMMYRNRPEIGVIYVPTVGQLYAALRGRGARCNGHSIKVSDQTTIAGATIGLDYSFSTPSATHRAHIEAIHTHGGEYRRNGSVAVSLARVASGRLDGFIELELNTWDVLAGIVLVQEAGGWTNDFLGSDGLGSKNPMIAAAPGIRDQLLSITGLERWN